jgi:hypothetical protein
MSNVKDPRIVMHMLLNLRRFINPYSEIKKYFTLDS